MSNSVIRGNDFGSSSCGAKLWLFLGFVMGFASVIAACWILFANFLLHEPSEWLELLCDQSNCYRTIFKVV